ncbi:FkbM family methyltransferase [Nitrospinaceae bacterium]|nr:FkbM family methyltransferase [Nitrospinaceae bacterium]
MPIFNSAVLPSFLRPYSLNSLVRIGKDNDGGYLVDPRCIAVSEILISFGVSYDWSFEKDFKRRNSIPVVAFDDSIGLNVFLRKLRVALCRGSRKSIFWFRLIMDYCIFFRGSSSHIKKFVGLNKCSNFVSVDTIEKENIPKNFRNIFFSIDIEGGEYPILDQLNQISDRICGMVIEFHEIVRHMDQILFFVENFPLKICHVHCNNYRQVDNALIPDTIEITFTKFSVEDSFVEVLPNPLDQPNNPSEQEYSLTFSE